MRGGGCARFSGCERALRRGSSGESAVRACVRLGGEGVRAPAALEGFELVDVLPGAHEDDWGLGRSHRSERAASLRWLTGEGRSGLSKTPSVRVGTGARPCPLSPAGRALACPSILVTMTAPTSTAPRKAAAWSDTACARTRGFFCRWHSARAQASPPARGVSACPRGARLADRRVHHEDGQLRVHREGHLLHLLEQRRLLFDCSTVRPHGSERRAPGAGRNGSGAREGRGDPSRPALPQRACLCRPEVSTMIRSHFSALKRSTWGEGGAPPRPRRARHHGTVQPGFRSSSRNGADGRGWQRGAGLRGRGRGPPPRRSSPGPSPCTTRRRGS